MQIAGPRAEFGAALPCIILACSLGGVNRQLSLTSADLAIASGFDAGLELRHGLGIFRQGHIRTGGGQDERVPPRVKLFRAVPDEPTGNIAISEASLDEVC